VPASTRSGTPAPPCSSTGGSTSTGSALVGAPLADLHARHLRAPPRRTAAPRRLSLAGRRTRPSSSSRYGTAARAAAQNTGPAVDPVARGCVASSRWARVGVEPLSGRDCWPQGQLRLILLLLARGSFAGPFAGTAVGPRSWSSASRACERALVAGRGRRGPRRRPRWAPSPLVQRDPLDRVLLQVVDRHHPDRFHEPQQSGWRSTSMTGRGQPGDRRVGAACGRCGAVAAAAARRERRLARGV
jgi:hypothetical protein